MIAERAEALAFALAAALTLTFRLTLPPPQQGVGGGGGVQQGTGGGGGGGGGAQHGGGGVLDRNIEVGQLLLVDGAIRDEGFSYHYMPPSRVICTDPALLVPPSPS